MSKPQARVALSLSCTMQAVAGKSMSGVTVATMMRSSSSAAIPRRSRHSRAARRRELAGGRARLHVRGAAGCPVRVRIHSSVVSTIFSRSALVTTRSGT